MNESKQDLQCLTNQEDTEIDIQALRLFQMHGNTASEFSDYLETRYNFYLMQNSETQQFSSMVLTPDSKYLILATFGSPNISVWSLSEKRIIKQLTGHSSPVLALCINPVSMNLFSSSSSGEVFKWNLFQNSQPEKLFEYEGKIIELLLSTSCNLLFGSDDSGKVLIFDLKYQVDLVEICINKGWNIGFLIIEKEKLLVTGSQDAEIMIWNFSGGLKESIKCFAGVTCIEKSRNEEFLAVGSHNCKIFIIRNFSEKFFLEDQLSTIFSMKFSNNDKNLASSSSLLMINVWDLETRVKIASVCLESKINWIFENHDCYLGLSSMGQVLKLNTKDLSIAGIDLIKTPLVSVQMTADSKFLIGFNSKAIFLYDILDSKPEIYQGHGKKIISYKVKNSLNLLVTVSADLTLKLWNLHEKNLRKTIDCHKFPVESYLITSEKLISLSIDLLCIWNLATDKLVYSISFNSKSRRCHRNIDQIILSKSKSILIVSKINLNSQVTLIKLDTLSSLSIQVASHSYKSLLIPKQDKYLVLSKPHKLHVFQLSSLNKIN